MDRFTVGNTIGGFEVIDRDGRPVSPCFPHLVAMNVADELNEAAKRGKRVLARALGAIDEA